MVKHEVTIQMKEGTTTYLFGRSETAMDFAESATRIHRVVQVRLNGAKLLPDSSPVTKGA